MTDFLLSHCWPLLASVAVKSLCILALAAAAALALRRSSAAAQHLVWRLALAGLLFLPLLSSLPAVWQIPLAPRALLVTPDAPIVTPTVGVAPDEALPAPNPGGAGKGQSGASPTPPELGAGGRSSPLPWPVWACALWLAGAVLTLLPFLIGLAGVGGLARRSTPVPDGPLHELATQSAQNLGVTYPIRLLLGDAGTPMTWGWRRPVILLPADADAWPADRLRAVLLHELAHVARADWPAQMASHLACALYWYNPAVWLTARQARVESERACDDRVLLAGVSAPDYARHLLDVARALNAETLPAALPMVRVSQIESRLTAILHSPKRGEVVRRATLIAGALTFMFLVGLAVLRVVVRLPATVDASTPLAQDGFTLLAVQRGDGADYRLDADDPQNESAHDANVGNGIVDGTGLWIQPPSLPAVSPDALRQEYRIHVRASNGTRFTLPYGLAENGYPTDGHPALLCVGLPPGYPDSDHYFDVTIDDRHGHEASWRLTHLPQMQHVLAPPIAMKSQFSRQGFTVEADAQHDGVDPHAGYSSGITATLRLVAFPSTPIHPLEMKLNNIVEEWQPADTPTAQAGIRFSESVLSVPLDLHSPSPQMSVGTASPYSCDTHLIGLDATLCQFETYDEPVTFHNVTLKSSPHTGIPTYCAVSAAQSVTTSAGITVTLPVVAKDQEIGMPWIGGGIDCKYSTSLPEQPVFLARSPLCRQYHRPVTVHVTVAAPYQISGTEGRQGPGPCILSFTAPKPYPIHLATLTLIVRQRVELQTIPLHFVVPVENTPPPVFRPSVRPKK